ncbi:ABC transporter substrate-binding protein [Histidinibacterium aquaticum]|uniref:ABC transporter substrate-binding protein n=1 Tax=Histidinibacterium aquaticum TaxID=2613962 RepID=A0A5J5GIR6_9RHOB|nr:ABC transporter substrate-binding protein [Histidinibacterium aquaticum]KAA9008139.1 ABC transporter substrate-binding protein [Histidinibacterium aquaticum]
MTRLYILMIGLLAAVLGGAVAAQAQETRTVTDDLGRAVEIPADPQRIASLHDTSLTVALLELGVTPVASHGRTTEDGTPYIRSSATATGVDFGNSDIAFAGNLPADLEAVAEAQPDLILTTSWQTADPEQLSQIAPTYVFDISETEDFEVYARIAELTGTTDRLEALQSRYDAQIDLIRQVVDTENTRVSVIQGYDGQLLVWNTYGTLGKVLRDAGFTFPDIQNAIEGNARQSFSAERLPEFDADLIFVTYRPDRGETVADARAAMASVLPSWCEALHACREDQVVFLPRSLASTATYDAAGALAYAVLSNIDGRDIAQLPR